MPDKEELQRLVNEAKKLEDSNHFPKAQKIREQILKLLSGDQASPDYIQAMIAYASNFFGQGRYIRVITLAKEAQALALAENQDITDAQKKNILSLQATAHERLGHTLSARACFDDLLSIHKKNSDLSSQQLVLDHLAVLSLKSNDLASCEKYMRQLFENILASSQTRGEHRLAILLEEFVKRLIENQDYLTARLWSHKEVQLHQHSLYKAEQYQDSHNYGKALNRLATICKKLGKLHAARVLYKAHINVVGPHLGKQYTELSDSIANLSQLDQSP